MCGSVIQKGKQKAFAKRDTHGVVSVVSGEEKDEAWAPRREGSVPETSGGRRPRGQSAADQASGRVARASDASNGR